MVNSDEGVLQNSTLYFQYFQCVGVHTLHWERSRKQGMVEDLNTQLRRYRKRKIIYVWLIY